MKRLTYFSSVLSGDEQTVVKCEMTTDEKYLESNLEIAKRESYNGNVEISEAVQVPELPGPVEQLGAKVAYIAMMSGLTEVL